MTTAIFGGETMKRICAVTAAIALLCLSIAVLAAINISISDAKLKSDSPTESFSLSGKVVTYAEANFFYIEEDLRSIGIRVEKTAHGLTAGMRADITGTMKTNTNRERCIHATNATQTPAPNSTGTVFPVGMNNLTLGGSNWQVVGTGGQKGASNSNGLNNTGLLIRTCGMYQQIDVTTFTIDDGSGLFVKCTVPSGTFLYSGWQYVSVTGISSMFRYNSSIYPPSILVRDIKVVSPVEAVSIPGTPSGNANPTINVSETYTTTGSTCSQGHPVEYSFNWGDGTSSGWSTSTSASHSWNASGIKTVAITARCQSHPAVSATSVGLQVNVTDSPSPGEMIYIPAGSFLMGNNGSEPYSYSNELPQHSVSLSGYWIGKYEVTRGEYRAFMNAGGYSNSSYWSTAGWSWKVSSSRTEPYYWAANQDWYGGQQFTQTDNHPVVGVCYYESEAFCNWAGGHLPTEAQWERAARWTGTHANVYPWGDVWDAEKCNNYEDHNVAGGGYGRYQTAPVGSYSSYPSPSGCQDMAGNVLEWCQDWYQWDYYSQSPSSDPQGPASGIYRVLRGGSWGDTSDYGGRCACRLGGSEPDPRSYDSASGFRLARDEPTTESVSTPGAPVGNQTTYLNTSETYTTTVSTCSQGHPVEYSFNWGDGTSSPWSASTSASHSWNALGTKTVTVTARCQSHPAVSATSAGLQVNVRIDPYTGELIYIPAGSFDMGNSGVGADATYASSYPQELPQHSVSLSGYWIGKYEVTRGEYRAFMNAGGYSNSSYWSTEGWSWKVSNSRTEPDYWAATQTWRSGQTFTQTDNHPVVGVSYYEAEAFCNWAGGHLPTEAQWERAARWTGTHANVYPWGDVWDFEKCNNYYDHNVAGGGYGRWQTAPVGSYSIYPSPSGCQDMAGNVWEWCKDWYLSNYYSQSPSSDPQGPASGSDRVLRGGGWNYFDFDFRCAYRLIYAPDSYNADLGFRLAR